MSTPKTVIKYSDVISLTPYSKASFSSSNLRNFNLYTPRNGQFSSSYLKNSFAFPTNNAPVSSMMVCYSVRKVVPTYTGPVFRLRRSIDNQLQDFYSDTTQSYLTTGANNTGTNLETWIGNGYASVTIWYDQSPNSNNALNNVNGTTQPRIITNQDKKTEIYFSYQGGTSPLQTTLIITTPIAPNTIFCNSIAEQRWREHYILGSTTSSIVLNLGDGNYYGSQYGTSISNVDWFFTAADPKTAYNNGSVLYSYGNGYSPIGSYYRNSITLSITTPLTSYKFNKIGANNSTAYFRGRMTELICYNKLLLNNDMLAYYNNSLFNYLYPVLDTPINSMIVCYSCRILNPQYTGPIFRLRRSSDNVLQDFYTDRHQSYLTTKINNSGISFINWVGSNIAYVSIWYDQSYNSNHAINITNDTTQPNISFQNSKYVLQFQNSNSTQLRISSPFLTSLTKQIGFNFYNTAPYGTIFSANTSLTFNFGETGTNIYGTSNLTDDWFYGSSGGDKYFSVNGGGDWSFNKFNSFSLNNWNLFSTAVGISVNNGSWTTIGYDNNIPSRSLNGYISEFTCYNNFTNVGISEYNKYSLFNTSVFPTINASPSTFMGCYSVRLIVPTYTGAIFKLRRSSDNDLKNFYTDSIQSYLTTGANNTGTTFIDWVGTSTAYVNTWYDQSTNARHATNTTNDTTQPNISLQYGKYVLQFQNANLTRLTIPTGIKPNAIFTHFYNTTRDHGTIACTLGSYDVFLRFGNSIYGGAAATSINGDQNSSDWYYSGGGNKYAYCNGIDSLKILVGQWNLLSLSITTLSSQTSFQLIGTDSFDTVRALNGYMSEIIFIKYSIYYVLNYTDMIAYYNTRLF